MSSLSLRCRPLLLVPTLCAVVLAPTSLAAMSEPILIHQEDFSDISEWHDLSTLLPWGSATTPGTSAFILGQVAETGPSARSFQALTMTTAAMANTSISSPTGLRGHSGLDLIFPTPVQHRYNILTVAFKARWSAVNPSSAEKGRVMVMLLGDHPADGPTVGDISNFAGEPYGRPTYHARLRPTTQLHQTSLLSFGSGNGGRFDQIVTNVGSWWLPTFVSNTDGSAGTYPGEGASFPASSWVASNQVTGGREWRDYRYEIAPDAQRLFENGVLIAEMPLPQTSSAPGYQYYDSFRGLRLGMRGDQPAYIADLRVTRTSTDLPAVLVSDAFEVPEDSNRRLRVLANDSDPEGGPLLIVDVLNAVNGTPTIVNDGSAVRFRPTRNFNGQASFTYVVQDQAGNLSQAEVVLTVTPVNDRPVPRTPTVRVNEDATVAFSLVGTDVDGDALTYAVLSQPVNGTLTGSGQFLVYTPKADFFGRDSFTYQVSDGVLTSRVGTVNIVVKSVNDLPTLRLPTAPVSVPVQQAATIATIMAWDKDSATIRARVTVTGGTVTLGRTDALTFVRGTGANDKKVVMKGDLVRVSNALRALVVKPSLSAAGQTTVKIELNDGPGWRVVEEIPVTVTAEAAPFAQSTTTGRVVMEAEHAHRVIAPGHQGWSAQSASNAAGGLTMQGLVDRGTVINPDSIATAPVLSFDVVFATAGTHYVWMRGRGPNVYGDSVHVAINGVLTETGTAGTFNTGDLHWAPWRTGGGIMTVTVPSPGLHTFDVYMREDGVIVDQFLLTTDPAFRPSTPLPESDREVAPSLPISTG